MVPKPVVQIEYLAVSFVITVVQCPLLEREREREREKVREREERERENVDITSSILLLIMTDTFERSFPCRCVSCFSSNDNVMIY